MGNAEAHAQGLIGSPHIKGWGEVPSWVFANSENKPLDADFFRHVWRKLLTKAGLRYVNVHALRHTYASLLLQSGVPIVYVKDQMGHSISITVDIYGYPVSGGNRDLVDQLDTPDTTICNPGATTPRNTVSGILKSASIAGR